MDRAAAVVASVAAEGPVPNSGSRSGWGRAGHRRAVLVGAVVAVVILGGGVAAWAEVGNGSAGYRMATVTRADIGTTLDVVGDVEPGQRRRGRPFRWPVRSPPSP